MHLVKSDKEMYIYLADLEEGAHVLSRLCKGHCMCSVNHVLSRFQGGLFLYLVDFERGHSCT